MNPWTLTLILLGWLAVIVVAGLILLALSAILVGFRSAWRKKDLPPSSVPIIGSGAPPIQYTGDIVTNVIRSHR